MKRGHTPWKCNVQGCQNEHPDFCIVCGGEDVELATHCPGRMMTDDEATLIHAGVLDFENGEWFQPVLPN